MPRPDRNVRFVWIEAVMFAGNMVDREFSTKWMTEDEAVAKLEDYMCRASFRIIKRERRY